MLRFDNVVLNEYYYYYYWISSSRYKNCIPRKTKFWLWRGSCGTDR